MYTRPIISSEYHFFKGRIFLYLLAKTVQSTQTLNKHLSNKYKTYHKQEAKTNGEHFKFIDIYSIYHCIYTIVYIIKLADIYYITYTYIHMCVCVWGEKCALQK